MACGLAVKRPHEYDYETYLSPESAVETKRSRPSNQPHCSPFRPQLGTLAASLMQSSASASKENEEVLNTGPLGFVKTTQLSGTQLEAYLTAEVQYLKRRKLIPSRAGHQSQSGGESSHDKLVTESSTSYRQGAVSPSSCHSGSDSDSETGSALDNRSSPQGKLMSMEALYEKPQFSLKQVKLICDRLLKEQEIRLRYEYETALNKKLEEQHESYVQFAKEQIDNRHSNNECFYLS
ncbi:akirin-1 [Ditylenchus destructor]|uniref:Akirin-1 n=1 Tax=Ditylenchus destructor TaxID=166010 RepID=A0AAD4MRK9_9BILA|nr:akirin-1 [Ditylenchus destructor]